MYDELTIAKRLLETIPQSMARIRAEIRSCIPRELTVPDFRILGSIVRGKNLVGDIAWHHGVSEPSMSRSIDGLVQSGLVERSKESPDRRQSPLKLTPKGAALFRRVTKAAERRLSKKVSGLDGKRREALLRGMAQLEKIFLPEHDAEAIPKGKKGKRT
ncbi:MAG: MarR family transcriptional regulator [Deltaproteobacteria bacterium]|nr:MarR family transcriptional regulator [Deltaproteobacteria bacterium]